MKSQLRGLKEWIRDATGGNSFLTGYEAETWASNKAGTFVCLEPPGAKSDPFTKWLLDSIIPLYEYTVGRHISSGEVIDAQSGDKSYSSNSVNRASNTLTAVLASAVPVLSILALNRIDSVNVRIGVTAAFTTFFALMMGIFSSAKRAEMIAATATRVFLHQFNAVRLELLWLILNRLGLPPSRLSLSVVQSAPVRERRVRYSVWETVQVRVSISL
jgi:hypothetical protein